MSIASYSQKNEKFCLELDRVRLLLEKAGNPDKDMSIIHIAGTNGKGSVCAFIEEGLTNAGIKCGRFSSPELFSVEDTISVNKVPIDKRALENIIKALEPLCDEVKTELGKAPSAFEILFVASLIHFKKKRCKKVILECGMGGKGDATNAIISSDIEVLTNIALDHREYLGESIEEIARNKCGILRKGKNVYAAVQEKSAEDVIIEECRKNENEISFVRPFEICGMDFLNAVVNTGFGKERLSLAGVHQAQNASLALMVMRAMDIDKKSILKALSSAVNRARLEKISDKTYFDGAHNPAGVRELVKSINAAKLSGKMVFAMGFMADKDIDGCLNELKNLENQNFEIHTATVFSNPRSEKAEKLKEKAQSKGFKAESFSDIYEATKAAQKKADIVFAFGSLYMYKELMVKETQYENR